LTTMRAFTPSATGIRFSWTRGVRPTNWVMSLAISGGRAFVIKKLAQPSPI
jgi:hypothetical protein